MNGRVILVSACVVAILFWGDRRSAGSISRQPRVAATPRTLAARIELVSRRHRGVPYRLDALGEGPGAPVDSDPVQTWKCVDCVTYVEQALAEALASSRHEPAKLLRHIRYRGGVVEFERRNHFFVADWLRNNRWIVDDLTETVGQSACRTMVKTIDRPRFFRRRAAAVPPGARRERVATRYIPRAALLRRTSRIPSGSLLMTVQARPGIFVAHTGFVFATGRGRRFLRHASQKRGRVADEDLAAFLRRQPRGILGAKICAFREAPLRLSGESSRAGQMLSADWVRRPEEDCRWLTKGWVARCAASYAAEAVSEARIQ